MNVIIFSKGRPAQLELLLRSMKHFAPAVYKDVVVQVNEFDAYDKVESIHHTVEWAYDGLYDSFKDTLIRIMDEKDPITVFFMDDMCFVHDLDVGVIIESLSDDNVLCYSSRLNISMDYCYTKGISVKPPMFNTWDWRGRKGDFGYPMSLDGHFFRTADILDLLKSGTYYNPNSLERWLSTHPIVLNLISCGNTNAVINNPNNRVQHIFKNRHEGGDLEMINNLFMEGKIISIDPYLNTEYNAPHVPIEIKMI